jgi:hypothetical protein
MIEKCERKKNNNMKIKINELSEIKPVIEEIKRLELENSPELNSEIIIEFGE